MSRVTLSLKNTVSATIIFTRSKYISWIFTTPPIVLSIIIEQFGPIIFGKSRRAARLNYCISFEVRQALNQKLASTKSLVHTPYGPHKAEDLVIVLPGKSTFFGFMRHWAVFMWINEASPPKLYPGFNNTSLPQLPDSDFSCSLYHCNLRSGTGVVCTAAAAEFDALGVCITTLCQHVF